MLSLPGVKQKCSKSTQLHRFSEEFLEKVTLPQKLVTAGSGDPERLINTVHQARTVLCIGAPL